jgi:hypothetical protein
MSILSNVNYAKKIVRHPCGTPNPIIMVEAAAQAALPLLFVPITFSCTDWIKASVGISWKCGKKLKAIARHVYGPKFTDGVHFLYEATGAAAAENALWIWFIADLAVDTYVSWVTQMYIEGNCDLPLNGTINGAVFFEVQEPGGDYSVGVLSPGSKPCVFGGGLEVQFPRGCYGGITYQCDWAPWPTGRAAGGTVQTAIRDNSTGAIMDVSTSPPAKFNGLVSTGGGLNHLPAGQLGTSYSIIARAQGTEMQLLRGSYTASGYGKPQPLIPAGCFGGPHGSG